MGHELPKEDLSAFLDDELSAQEKKKVTSHLAGCAQCRKDLDALRLASAGFRSKAAKRAPAELADRILDAAKNDGGGRQARDPILNFAIWLAVALIVIATTTGLFKAQIGNVFNQVMGMISGAASSVGSGR